MPASPVPVESAAPPTKPEMPGKEQSVAAGPSSRWQRYVTPVLVILLALAVFVTLVRNWNSLGRRQNGTGYRRLFSMAAFATATPAFAWSTSAW
jgi:hypothetical protein